MVTESTTSASYAFTYIIKLFRTGLKFDCSGGISFASRESFNTKKVNTQVYQSNANAQDLSAILEILIKVLGDATEAIALAEVVIDISTI